MSRTIKSVKWPKGPWVVATMDRENNDGCILLPVACWGIVGEDGVDSVVPFVVPADEEPSSLTPVSALEDVIGIGPATNDPRHWDDLANQLRDAEGAEDERKEREVAVSKLRLEATTDMLEILRFAVDPDLATPTVDASLYGFQEKAILALVRLQAIHIDEGGRVMPIGAGAELGREMLFEKRAGENRYPGLAKAVKRASDDDLTSSPSEDAAPTNDSDPIF